MVLNRKLKCMIDDIWRYNMNSSKRRKLIYQRVELAEKPISASLLAQEFGVSRQSVVGDIAILRASGMKIIATTKGYQLESNLYGFRYIQRLACYHSIDQFADELEIIVRYGGEIIDVIVEHELYGEFTGQLNISTYKDIEDFIQRRDKLDLKLLSELTEGIHLHTIAAKDKVTFEKMQAELFKKNFLVDEI